MDIQNTIYKSLFILLIVGRQSCLFSCFCSHLTLSYSNIMALEMP